MGSADGTLARWLLDQVGESGRVLALEREEERLRRGLAGTRAEVRGLDRSGVELPEGEFDLVHVRVTLCNLPAPDALLRTLIHAARPGGVIVLADLDFTTHRPIQPLAAWNRAWPAFLRGLEDAGWDPAFGRRLPGILEASGLERVEAETLSRYVRGGSLTCRMTLRALERAARAISDLAPEDLEVLRPALADPDQAWVAPDFTIAAGWRPLTTA